MSPILPAGRASLALLLALTACQPEAPAETSAAAPANVSPTTEAPVVAAALPADAPVLTVFKSPTCGCCTKWAEYMGREGFRVETVERTDMAAVRDSLGVPGDLSACHTATVGGYTVEGHVPAEHVRRLLTEAPRARGIAVPGMPMESPGMEQGGTPQPFDVLLVDDAGEATVFARVPGA